MTDSEAGTQGTQDLDSIINDYEANTQPAQQPAQVEGLDKVVAYINDQQAKEEADRIKSSVERLIGDSSIDYDLAHGFLLSKANQDKSIDDAFTKSLADPDGWNSILDKLGEDLRGKFPSIDQQATSDTEEMVSAVTGSKQSTNSPDEAPDYSGLSNSEFADEMRKLGI